MVPLVIGTNHSSAVQCSTKQPQFRKRTESVHLQCVYTTTKVHGSAGSLPWKPGGRVHAGCMNQSKDGEILQALSRRSHADDLKAELVRRRCTENTCHARSIRRSDRRPIVHGFLRKQTTLRDQRAAGASGCRNSSAWRAGLRFPYFPSNPPETFDGQCRSLSSYRCSILSNRRESMGRRRWMLQESMYEKETRSPKINS